MIRVVDTKRDAIERFRVFHDRPYRKEMPQRFSWPSSMQEIGYGHAEMYRSNKWKKKLDEFEEYKHIVESNRYVYCEPGFLREWSKPRRKLDVVGPFVSFTEPMPQHFTVLGPLIGVQIQLYEEDESGDVYVAADNENLYEVEVARGMLGAADHPETGETFLIVYSSHGVHMVLTGERLAVEKEGITG